VKAKVPSSSAVVVGVIVVVVVITAAAAVMSAVAVGGVGKVVSNRSGFPAHYFPQRFRVPP
jgi:hypothetical protein